MSSHQEASIIARSPRSPNMEHRVRSMSVQGSYPIVVWRLSAIAHVIDLHVLHLPLSVLEDPYIVAPIPYTVRLSDIVKRIFDPVRVDDTVEIL